jgi:hypothetical protein
MHTRVVRLLFLLLVLLPVAAFAQVTVTLPNTAQTTTLTANVSEQATVTVPATVTFNVTNVNTTTASASQSVTTSSVVLADGKSLKISLEANAATFTAPAGGGTTWAAGDVTWNAATWSNSGVGATGTLSNSAFTQVATCAPNTACSTSTLVFTLAANAAVARAGNHTLVVTWKFESI